MPELPEIEHLKRTLEPVLLGARVLNVRLRRRDIVSRCAPRPPQEARKSHSKQRRITAADLLKGTTIASLERLGKNLAIIGDNQRVLCIHLGMSGQMRFVPLRDFARHSRAGGNPGAATSARSLDSRLRGNDKENDPLRQKHIHCIWQIDSPRAGLGQLIFRDPRRFGGLIVASNMESLRENKWCALGPDALTIDSKTLRERLSKSDRPMKAALLEQSFIAGVGNIYADESLFRARIHPQSVCSAIPPKEFNLLAKSIREVLRAAIESGGSTISSYIDVNGNGGRYAKKHLVYGRGGEPCPRCGSPLLEMQVAQRTTVCCAKCQKKYGS